MADRLGMDPARIERLRSPDRLEYFDPGKIWDELNPPSDCTVIDIGTGVGFVALPLAERYPGATVYGCDILDGMIELLTEDAAARGLGNVRGIVMQANSISLADDTADIIVMAQLHHELDEPAPLLAECKRLLRPGGTIAIVDWADADNGKSPPVGRRVPVARLRDELTAAGFTALDLHDVYDFHTFITGTA